MAEIHDLSPTDASNVDRFPENQAPSTVNNGARALEGIIARYFFDNDSSTVATLSGSVIQVTANRNSLTLTGTTSNYVANFVQAFTMGANPILGAASVNIDAVGPVSLRDNTGASLSSSVILAAQRCLIIKDGANDYFRLIYPEVIGSLGRQNADSINVALNEAQGANIASATTTDIGAATGNYIHVTGTTTITGLGTVQAGTRRIVRFIASLTLTHNGTSLILPTSANIVTQADDRATFVSLGSGNWICTNYQRANGASVSGGVVQEQRTQSSAVATGTTTAPHDDTIPQNTEGDEYITVTITPTSATNLLIIEAELMLGSSNGGAATVMTLALIQDTTANALAAMGYSVPSGDEAIMCRITHEMTAGTASATTFRIRAGTNTAGTTTFNGNAAARIYGGVAASYLKVTETTP